jgi:ankyrin repeat protein
MCQYFLDFKYCQAVEQGNKECISALIQLNADILAKDSSGKTPLDLAKTEDLRLFVEKECRENQVGPSDTVRQV